MVTVDATAFLHLGRELVCDPTEDVIRSAQTEHRRFRGSFGTSPEVCAVLWEECKEQISGDALPMHLLWALKLYASESFLCLVAGVDEKNLSEVGLESDLCHLRLGG